MSTPYSIQNANFSNNAHVAAQTQIYPRLFNVAYEQLHFETVTLDSDIRHQILDGEMAVDRIVKIDVETFKGLLSFTVQERFRRPNYKCWQDITITEWNNNTNLPSELYKLSGGLFLYGYATDGSGTKIDQAIVFSSSHLLISLTNGHLKYTKKFNPRTQQTFLGITFKDMRDINLILYEYNLS